ncbi:MAG: hypothetical protein WBA10_08535 [Elainellaceae cyanobacterium]
MKAIETIATINEQGQLSLDHPLELPHNRRVKVIVLISEDGDIGPDDTPTDVVIAGLEEGMHQAMTGQTLPLSQLWDGIDAD